MPTRVTVWNEFRHEKKNPKVAEIYPDGIHNAIANHLKKNKEFAVNTAWLDQPSHGLTDEVINNTDVFVWWGHMAHGDVADAVVENVFKRIVSGGAGFLALHSGHFAKVFKRLMGTSCDLKWREADDREILWVTRPGHSLVRGINDHFILPAEEMYGEFFDIPEPEETVMISSFSGGEVFRSLCTWRRGAGRVVYFRPGHETYPTYHNADVLKVIDNAVRWLAPVSESAQPTFGNRPNGWMEGTEKGPREEGFR